MKIILAILCLVFLIFNVSYAKAYADSGKTSNSSFLYAKPELFYDNLDSDSKVKPTYRAFPTPTSPAIDRYGAKINAGINLLPGISTFATAGLANVRNKNGNNAFDNKNDLSEFTPIYGVGLMVDLPMGITAKASYDYQDLKSQQTDNNRNKDYLGTSKIGVIYNF